MEEFRNRAGGIIGLIILLYLIFVISKGVLGEATSLFLNIASVILLYFLYKFLNDQIDGAQYGFDEKVSKYWRFVSMSIGIHLGLLLFSRIFLSLKSILAIKIGLPLLYMKFVYDFMKDKDFIYGKNGQRILCGTIGVCFVTFLLF